MGRKSRAKIEDEFYREQYFRYLKMLGNPEYRVLWKKLNKINKKLKTNANDVKIWSEKESIEKELKSKYCLAIPVIEHSIWEILTEEEKEALELPIDPTNPLTEDEFKYFIESICPIFRDMDIIERIPFKQPRLIPDPQDSERSKLDFTDYLWPDPQTGEPRYLRIKIDTWNKKERIEAALKEALDFLQELRIISFKSRLRLSTEEEQIRAMELRSQDKTYKEIAYDMWPKQFEKWVEEQKTAKKENLEGEERNLYEQFVQRLLEEGKTMGEAYNEADKKFGLREKEIGNPLIIKVHYLLSRKSK